MKAKKIFNRLAITFFLITGFVIASCSRKTVVSFEQTQRIDSYVYSDNENISEMFCKDVRIGNAVQPALTQKELEILDALVDRIDPEVFCEFDQKYTAWLNCWAPLDSLPIRMDTKRKLLKCNGFEFQDLIDYCRQQDEDVFLLFCQLAARADCPYDQFLLHPVYDLLNYFPDFCNNWHEVDVSLQKEKPDSKNRTCNESTIWHVRKILASL